MRKPFVLLIFSFVFAFVSCSKNNNDDNSSETKNMDNLRISSGFSWKTTKDYNFTLTSPVTGLVELSDDKGSVYYKAMLTENQQYTFKISLPNILKQVNIRISGKTETIVLESDNINFTFTK
jgi:hypothetical protein